MKTTRPYTMTARARSTEETRRRILTATIDLHLERPAAGIGLEDIAARADVSVQTILRHFGTRDGLVEAATAQAQEDVREERRTPVGDVAAAVEVLMSHYEARGDSVLVLLAQEDTEAFAREITSGGKQLHRAWVAETFGFGWVFGLNVLPLLGIPAALRLARTLRPAALDADELEVELDQSVLRHLLRPTLLLLAVTLAGGAVITFTPQAVDSPGGAASGLFLMGLGLRAVQVGTTIR